MLNVIALMGRVVADPELKKTKSDISVTQFSIACERNFAKQGEKRETDFFDIVAWRSSAEFASKYFKKGQLVAVNGSLQTRSYEDKNGVKRKVYEIVADNLHFAESKKDNDKAPPPEEPPSYGEGDADDFAVMDESEDLPF